MTIRIVLVGTTHPGNIGAVARAMKNMGLSDLALVNPRHFPHEDATAARQVRPIFLSRPVVSSLAEALTDCVYVAGASARSRTISWPSMGPRDCAERMLLESKHGKVAAVFGPEKTGLHNDDLDLCHTLLTIPTNPDFSSLNLAMAVQVLTYELRVAAAGRGPGFRERSAAGNRRGNGAFLYSPRTGPAGHRFLDPDNPRHLMRRMRRLFIRARPDKNEVNILRGILTAVDRIRRPE